MARLLLCTSTMRFVRPAVLLFLLAACACGGRTSDPASSGADADGGAGAGDDAADPGQATSNGECTSAPAQHRAVAVACAAHPAAGTGMACSDDATCLVTDAGAYTPQPHPYCFRGTCGMDQCLSDADCQSNEVCACAGSLSGEASGTGSNRCVPAGCHVDSDCGRCGLCSPSASYTCGPTWGAAQYACHHPGDPCFDDTACQTHVGDSSTYGYCAWNPMSGGWSCNTGICGG